MSSRETWKALSRLEKLANKGAISEEQYAEEKQALYLRLESSPSPPPLPIQPASSQSSSTSLLQKNYVGNLSDNIGTHSISMDDLQAASSHKRATPHHHPEPPRVFQHPERDSGAYVSLAPKQAISTKQTHNHIQVGQILRERYQLKRMLASGGMGRVFLVEDIKYGGQYALKALHPWVVQNDNITRRFIQEFKLTETLSHPGIVRTFTLDEDMPTGCLFYTMEYVQGVTLQAIIENAANRKKGPPLRLKETYRCVKQLAEILDYAHQKRIIHRDLKPANIILVDGRERLKLVDFGIAKAMHTHPTLHTGHGGTYYYIAPEQLSGGHEVRPAADIFSLGVLLYQLLTGEIPVAMAVPPSELNAQLNKQIDNFIRKAIHPRAAQRYQSVTEWMETFEQIFPPLLAPTTHKTLPNTSSSSSTPQEPLHKRYRAQRIVLPHERRTTETPPPPPSPQFNKPPSKTATKETLRVERQFKTSSMTSLHAHEGAVTALAISPDGRLLASGSEDCTIKIWESSSWFLLHTFSDHADTIQSLQWSPDGRYVISGSSDCTIKIWDVFSARLFHLFQHEDAVYSVLFGNQGKQVISAGQGQHIKLWDSESGRPLGTLEGHQNPIRSLDIDLQRGVLASGSEDTTVKLWSLHTGALLHTFEEYWTVVNAIKLCPQHQQLASATDDGNIKLWGLDEFQITHTLKGHQKSVVSLATSPQGDFLLSSSLDHTIRLWSLPDGVSAQVFDHGAPVHSVCVSPDGRWMVTGAEDASMKIWDTSPYFSS